MPVARSPIVIFSSLLLAACAVAETAPPPATLERVTLEVPVDTPPPPPPPPPAQASREPVQERWRAPFAVRSSGQPAERESRRVVVVAAERPTPPPASDSIARATPAPAARPAAAPAPPAGVRTHKVEWGETWYGIARRYEVAPAALATANPDIDPERLRSGQVLRIPATGAARPGQRTHTVAAGETLWSIARRYGVSVDQLRQANRLRDDQVRSGQTLIVP